MPLASTGAGRFVAAHPEWDGRGVLIAILDSGVDPGAAGLETTSTGQPKLVDLRDFSGEASVSLSPAEVRGDTVFAGRRPLLGMSRVRGLTTGPWFAGVILERPLGQPPASDLNENGSSADSLPVVVARGNSGWVLFADLGGNGSLADDRPVHDYLVARETFGWHRAGAAAPIRLAANFSGDGPGPPLLRLAFDTEAHGTHVAGIAAARSIGGVPGFDGVAPGAQLLGLKISRNDLGGITTTGSVVAALDYAIRFARGRAMPLVVNMSFGVGNEQEGTARIDRLVDSILGANPEVVFVTSAGNDGPGISTLGFPGSSRRAITVGAIQPAPFLPGSRGPEPVLYFSSRGGELAKPDLLAPGTAYSTVPPWNTGEEFKSGTSMASPQVAGMAALLLSAAVSQRLAVSAEDVRRALLAASRPLPGIPRFEQGAGVPEMEAAWRSLHGAGRGAGFDVELAGQPGHTAAFAIGRIDSSITFRVSRTGGDDAVDLVLSSDAAWLVPPARYRLTGSSGLITLSQNPPRTPGVHSASVTARVAGAPTPSPGFRLVSTVVVPWSPAAGDLAVTWPSVAFGGAERAFFAADSARPFQVMVEPLATGQRIIASLHQPGGQPIPGDNGIPGGRDTLAAVFAVDGRDARSGYYEAVASAPPEGSSSARVLIRHSPARLTVAGGGDSLAATLLGLVDTVVLGTLRFAVIGGERSFTIDTAGTGDIRIPVGVPGWAREVVADLQIDPGLWPRFTDFGFAVADADGEILAKEPANYGSTRMRLVIPPDRVGRPLQLLLAPGFAEAGPGEPWRAGVTVRFVGSRPVILTPREGDAFRLPPRGSTRFHARIGPLPLELPGGLRPLILFLLEAGGGLWSWQLAPGS